MHRITWVLLALLPHLTFSQERCEVLQNPAQDESDFENWIQAKIQERRIRTLAQGLAQTEAEVLTIPIVVHVIHNGEAVGEGSNISEAQIQSQIQVLNEDFRRMNADTIDTPEEFLNVAYDTKIEFVLARQDPEGLPTNGITRTRGTMSGWRISDNNELTSLSFWSSYDYFNIWVTNLLPASLLGYAQFPISDLEGLETEFNANPNVDGVVIGYKYFGSSELGDFPELKSPFDLGRTTTHEIGHFLGLRHVWGDVLNAAGCEIDDYVSDTPISNMNYLGCAEHPQSSCGSVDMTSNYLYFSDDACMDIFSKDQTERMRIVLDTSPRRKSLVNSIGTQDPVIVDNNAGIRQILSPSFGECDQTVSPVAEVRNYGTNVLSSFRISLKIDGQLVENLEIIQDLNPLELMEVNFPTVFLETSGLHDFTFEITQTNGGQDNFPDNNSTSIKVASAHEGLISNTVDFNQLPADWIIRNPDESITWELADAPGNGLNNQALSLNFFNYDLNAVGEFDFFISPLLDFSGVIFAEVSFKVAYARSGENYPEGLIVGISRDCGNTVDPNDIPYQKFGNSLSTRSATASEFIPNSPSEWRTEIVNLSEFSDLSDIQIVFIGQNGSGNNLFIDDILIRIEREFKVEILSPVPISCDNEIVPLVEIVNPRLETMQSAIAQVVIPGEINDIFKFDSLNTAPGQSVVLEFPRLNLEDGDYHFEVTIISIDGDTSGIQGRNMDDIPFLIDNTTVEIPIRETFETGAGNPIWKALANPLPWELTTTKVGGNQAVYVANYVNPMPESSSWLAGPVVDMSSIFEASMFFKVSHANFPGISDTLQVLASIDCGESFTEVIYQKSDSTLGVTTSDSAWFPQSELDWRTEFIDISNFAGFPEVRFAFVATNSGGNNIFVDDIEFFLSIDPEPAEVELNQFLIYPNPGPKVFQVVFNLAEKQDLTIAIYDASGRFVLQTGLTNILNQTKTFDLTPYPYGVYFLKIVGSSFSKTQRVSMSY